MSYRFWLKLAVILTALALIVAAIEAWRADRHDRAQLAAELAATKQLVAASDARQHDRDAQLAQTLAALDAQKRAILTPAQIVHELQKSIPLPAPLTLQQAFQNNDERRGTTNRAPSAVDGAASSAPGSRATFGSPAPMLVERQIPLPACPSRLLPHLQTPTSRLPATPSSPAPT